MPGTPNGGKTILPAHIRPDALDLILERTATGMSPKEACAGRDLPTALAFRKMLVRDDALRERWLDALALRVAFEAENILSIADGEGEGDVSRDKLRVDARFKLLAKLQPERFGERVTKTHEVGGQLAELLSGGTGGHALPGEARVIEDADFTTIEEKS